MIISGIALSLFIGLVGVTLLGGRLRRFVPSEQLSAESKDAVKLALGLVATMTAILLGLLISSSKGAFDTARTEVMQMAAKVALVQAQAVSSVSKPLLIALAIWLVVIFFGFSLLAPANATNTLALVAGAFSVACAVLIILELDYPFAGIIRIPSDPMVNTLAHLAKDT